MEPVSVDDIEWTELDREDAEFKRKQLGEAGGSERIGCSLYELPAGRKSWPYHYHTANEEAIYVLSGSGTARLEDGSYPIEAGTYLALPADSSGGHRIVNDSEGALKYLAISTMIEPDVTVYPDSEKLGVFVGSPPGGRGKRELHGYYRQDDDVDYWDD